MGIILILLLVLILLLLVLWLWSRGQSETGSEAQFGSGWSVRHNADWTPHPPSASPLGPPNSSCTGGAVVGSWAHFTFPPFSVPSGAAVTGILVRFKYLSQSGGNRVQLSNSGTLVGNAQPLASVTGASRCPSTTFTSVGGDGDTWGDTFSATDVNGGAVGVRLTQEANTVEIDAVELTVFYSTA